MAIITWNNSLSVTVGEIDDDHKKLVDIVNRLHDAMKAGEANEHLNGIFKDLLEYTVYHFQHEEKLMVEHSYPDSDAHKKEHKDLVNTALELQAKLKNQTAVISLETLNFLRGWLVNHIQKTDKQFGQYLSSKGLH